MFRIVVKSNLTLRLAEDLTEKLEQVLNVLDDMKGGYECMQSKLHLLGEKTDVDNVPITPMKRMTLHRRSVMKELHSKVHRSDFLKEHTKIVVQDIC